MGQTRTADIEAQLRAKSDAALVTAQSLHAFEIRVGQCVKAQYPHVVIGKWTGRDLRNAKHFLTHFGREQSWRVIEFAVTHWGFLQQQRMFVGWMNPIPTFHDLYAAMDRIAGYLAHHDAEIARHPGAVKGSPAPVVVPAQHPLDAADATQRSQVEALFRAVQSGGLQAALTMARALQAGPDPVPAQDAAPLHTCATPVLDEP